MKTKFLFFKLLFLAVLFGSQGHAQISSYNFVQSAGTYADLVGPTVLGTATGNAVGAPSLDDNIYNIPNGSFPFTFTYNGIGYTGCNISSNGFISFGATAPATNNYIPISNTATYAGSISAWGADLNGMFAVGGRTSTISWQVVGSSPNREVVIQWKDFRPVYNTSTTLAPFINFQVRLRETTNAVIVMYGPSGNAVGSTNVAATTQIGLRGANNTFATSVRNRTNTTAVLFTASTAGTVNTSTQNYSSVNATPGRPSDGLIYTWSPPTCFLPSGLAVSGLTTTSANCSWTAASPAPSLGYEWWVSTSATPPASGTFTAGLTASATGLTPSTTYYLHVRSSCGSGDFSPWATSATFFTGYCVVSGTSGTYFISNVTTTGGVTNFNNTTTWTAGGYQNNTGISVSQSAGLPINFSLAQGGAGDMGCNVWVDWNNDLVFSAGEVVYTSGYVFGTRTGSFNVPSLQAAGNYRMRVRMDYNSTSPLACGAATNSEAEDYTITVLPPPTCIAPTALTNGLTSTTSANHSWTAAVPVPGNGYQWWVSTSATPPASGTATMGTSVSSTGLTPNTTYYLHVRSDCGAGDFSSWATSATFFTGYCAVSGTSGTYFISNVTTSGGATNINNTTGWTAGGYQNNTAMVCSQSAGFPINFSLSQGGGSDMSCNVWVDWNNDLVFSAGEVVYTSGFVLGTRTGFFTVPPGQALGNYRMRVRMDWLTNPPAACGAAAWSETEDYTITVISPPTCYVPTGISASVITITSLAGSWTAPSLGTAPASYNYEVRTSGAAGSGATGLAASGTTVTTSFTATGLTTNTTYSVYVQSNCGGGDLSSWSAASTVFLGYCTPIYTIGKTDGDLISNISISGTTLANNTGTAQVNPSYTFFSGLPNHTGNLQAGSTYSVNVTVGTWGYQGIAAWIDYNDDGVFSTSERIGFTPTTIGTGTGGTPIPANHTAAFNITLACNPPLGIHRMRVRDVFNVNGNLIDPCTSYAYGETEDYLVNVTTANPCPTPSALASNTVTSNSANIAWVLGCAETAWDIDISTSATPSGTPSNPGVTSTTFGATGLLSGTLYYAHVRANCGGSGLSSWTTISFTTRPACATGLVATPGPCSNQDLVFSWNASVGATAYSISLGTTPGGTQIANNVNVGNALFIPFTNPDYLTTYYWTLIPNNATGVATGCAEQMYTTGNVQCVCVPTYTTGKTAGDLISNVTILGTTLANNSGTAPTNPAYTFFNSLPNHTANLQAGTSYTVNVSVGTFGGQNMAAWIDFNDNTIFEPSERIGFTTTSIGANGSASFTISLPCNPNPGVHRMRIRDVWFTAGNLIDPCANYGWGETEDYNVTVLPPPPCPQISALASSAVTTTSANLNWTLGCAETAWDVHISTSPAIPTTPSNPGVTSTAFAATGLISNTVYYVFVRANCGATTSAWSQISFTTLLAPPLCATGLVATPGACSNIDLVFSWNAALNASAYSISLGTTPGGTQIANNVNVGNVLSIPFTNPSLNTTYYWTVRPSNAAGTASGCVEQIYTTGSVQCICIPSYTTGKTDGDLISNVSIGGTSLANNSGTAQVNPAYTYFTGLPNYTANLQAGTSYPVTVTVGTWGNQGIAAWIDFNDNNIFEASEKIGFTAGTIGSGTGSLPIPVNHTTTFTISLPCNPAVGVHRMRIRDVYNVSGNLIDPCANYTWGETEDYDVTVVAPPPCPQTSPLVASAVTMNSASLNWTLGCLETAWDVHISTSPAIPTTPNNPGVSSTTFAATGLLSNTVYYAFVRANCGTSTSFWMQTTFTTALAPPANDDCASAINMGAISQTPNCQVVELGAATQSLPANCGSGTNDVWYTFTVPASAGPSAIVYYSATNNTGNQNRSFQLFTACGGMSIACSVLQSGTFTVPPGTYTLRTYAPSASNFNLCIYLAPPIPSNDAICSALNIKPTGATSLNSYGFYSSMDCNNATTNTSLATATGATEASCGGTNGKSVWYKFTTPACVVGGVVPFQIEMSTDNALTSFDTKIQLFSSSTGTCSGTLTSIQCVDDGASTITSCGGTSGLTSTIVRTDLLPSTNYFLLIDGFQGASGLVEVSGRALSTPQTVTAISPSQVTITTQDKGASLYSYYIRQVGSSGYSITNSTGLSLSPTVANGFSYETQILYRCSTASAQFYRSPVITVNVPSITACTAVSLLNCAPNGGGSYTLTWPTVSGLYTNSGALSGYIVYYRVIGSTGFNVISNPSTTCSPATCTFTLAGLNDPAGYEFWIKTRCSSTVALQSNITTCAGTKSAVSNVHSFVNPSIGTEFVDVSLTDDWNDFDLVFPDLGDYAVRVNKENEIYFVKTAEPNMINAGADVSFELIPNPTNASTTMTFNNTIKSGTFQVVDAMGRNILSGEISNTNAIELDGSNWNAGVYIVKVTTNDKTTTRRLVISK